MYLRGLAGMTPSGPGLQSARDHLPQRGRQGRRIVMRPYTLDVRMASPRVERDPLIAPQPSWGRALLVRPVSRPKGLGTISPGEGGKAGRNA